MLLTKSKKTSLGLGDACIFYQRWKWLSLLCCFFPSLSFGFLLENSLAWLLLLTYSLLDCSAHLAGFGVPACSKPIICVLNSCPWRLVPCPLRWNFARHIYSALAGCDVFIVRWLGTFLSSQNRR